MKQAWRRLATRFDGMSRRERALIAAAVILGVPLVADSLFIAPNFARARAQKGAAAQAGADLATLRAQIHAVEQARKDPDAANRAALEQAKKELAGIDARLAAVQGRLVAPSQMARLLDGLLAGGRLRLLELRTLAPTSVLASAESQSKPGAKESAPVADAGNLFRHGIEIRLEGSYADIVAYLAELERMPQSVLWGRASMQVGVYPRAVLTLTVYTLSLEKTWLAV